MADEVFPVITPSTIVGVRDIRYEIFDPDPDPDPDPDVSESQSMTFEAQIIWSDGSVTVERGNLVPHLTTAEVTSLQTLASRLRAKAETTWGDAP